MPGPNDRNAHRSPPPRGGGAPGGGFSQPSLETKEILFAELSPELFNEVAKQVAQTVGMTAEGRARKENKPTQLRRFYDELCMWQAKVGQSESRFNEYLPFIRMLNAKVAYAQGRRLVDQNFVTLVHHTLQQVTDCKTLNTCKLFFEAFLGFYKQVRPTDG